MDALELLILTAVFVVAGAVKGVTGMGLPTVAISLLGLWMAPAQAAALLVVPSLVTNLMQCRGAFLMSLFRRLWPGWLALGAATVLAPAFGGDESGGIAKLWLGAVLVMYGVWGLWRPVLPDLSSCKRWWSLLFGGVTGLVTAYTAVFVLPWVAYLQALRMGKDELVQALGLSFTVATVALAVRLQAVSAHGPWGAQELVAVGVTLVGACGGLRVGARLRGRLAGASFQRSLFFVFVALGVANLARAV
ncbi:MAG: sulfite exporter TauE/SafE family protein [Burkholderiaceae bacterium]